MRALIDSPMGALRERLLGLARQSLRAAAQPAGVSPPERRGGLACLCVGLAIVTYAVLLSLLSIERYTHFRASAFDLGIYDQALWLISQGHLQAFSTVRGVPILRDHWTPILFPLGLIYRVWPDPRSMLVFQSFWLGLGAWPLFRWTSRAAGSSGVGAWVAVAYLLYPATLYTNLWDIHPSTFAATPLLFAMGAIDRDAPGSFLLWLGVALLCKESVALAALAVAGSLMIRPKHRSVGLAALTMAAAALVFIHLANPDTPYVYLYRRFGKTLPQVALGCITSPGLVARQVITRESGSFLLNLLYPCLYLPLLAPMVALPAAPELLLDMLSSRHSMHTIRYQYTSTVAPFLWLATAQVVAKVHRKCGWNAAPLLVVACGLAVAASRLPALLNFGPPSFSASEVQQVAACVPPGASLCVTPSLLPHFDRRRLVYAYPNPFCPVAWGDTVTALTDQQYGVGLSRARGLLRAIRRRPVDFVLMAMYQGAWPCTPNLGESAKQSLLTSRYYRAVLRTDNLVLLRACSAEAVSASGGARGLGANALPPGPVRAAFRATAPGSRPASGRAASTGDAPSRALLHDRVLPGPLVPARSRHRSAALSARHGLGPRRSRSSAPARSAASPPAAGTLRT